MNRWQEILDFLLASNEFIVLSHGTSDITDIEYTIQLTNHVCVDFAQETYNETTHKFVCASRYVNGNCVDSTICNKHGSTALQTNLYNALHRMTKAK